MTAHPHPTGLGPGGDRLAIVIDQAADLGGQERVIEALLDHYPAATAMAPHFTPTNRPVGYSAPWHRRVQLFGHSGRRRPFLAPYYARRVARRRIQADVVLSVTQGGWSMAARVPGPAVHLCYHSGLPNHLYGGSAQYLRDQPRAARPLFAAAIPALRAHDRSLMRRPGRVITNSAFSAEKIERVHGRKVAVLHPPVRTHFFTPAARPRRHFLVVSRAIAYKRIDVVIEAFRGLEADLVVAGGGPKLEELRRTAPPNVRFAGPCGDPTLRDLYRSSRALICPSLETFGLAMAEAHATGTPVIGLRAGGALEVVASRETGMLVDRPEPRSIAEAVRALDSMPVSARACRESAERFAQPRFNDAMHRIFEEELESASPRAPRR